MPRRFSCGLVAATVSGRFLSGRMQQLTTGLVQTQSVGGVVDSLHVENRKWK